MSNSQKHEQIRKARLDVANMRMERLQNKERNLFQEEQDLECQIHRTEYILRKALDYLTKVYTEIRTWRSKT